MDEMLLKKEDVFRDEVLDEEYEEIVNKFGNKDYSDETVTELCIQEIRVKPEKTQTQIAMDRELCIAVLEQELRLVDIAKEKTAEAKATSDLIELINYKPELIHEPFVEEPLPDKPERPFKKNTKIGAVYSNMSGIFTFFNFGFGKFIGAILSIAVAVGLAFVFAKLTSYFSDELGFGFDEDEIGGLLLTLLFGLLTICAAGLGIGVFFGQTDILSTGLVAVILFPIFLLSIIPIIVSNTIKENRRAEQWEAEMWNYQCRKRQVEEANRQNLIEYEEACDNAEAHFECCWKNAESDRNTKTEKLKEILLGQQKEAMGLIRIVEHVKENIFTVPKEYDTKEKKEKILFYLKTFKATTFTEAVNRIDEDEARERAFVSQERHQQELIELEKQKLEEEEEYNRQAALREKERLAMQREALEIQKRLQEEEKKRAEILQKTQKELSQHLSSIQEKLEEANAPNPNDMSRVSARDIEEIVRRYSN